MKIAFNPSTVAALTTPPNNKDITFDLRGHNIFARGVKFCGTDTNTWRDIKINNVSIGSNTLDLRNGSNTTLTNTNGVVTINSTWRPVVDNLTSDSTTSSLSANLGRVLAGLINGKSDSDHNHDDRYLKLTGGIMTGTINRRSGGTTISGRDHAIIRLTYAPGGSSWNPIACVDTETGTWTLGHLSSGDSDTNFHFCFSTNTDYNAGNNNGNYVTLRNKVGTIALTSDIPNKNSWNYDDRYYTKAESNAKYITDITTSVNKLTFTKNGSNIAKDITVNVVYNLGNLTNISDKNATTKASSGLFIYNSYNLPLGTNLYSSVLSINTGGTIQIAGNWGDDLSRNLYWRSLSDRAVSNYPWKSWRTILDSENYSSTLDSRYYTESEVNSLLDAKLNRQNLSYGTWNPRGYNLAADYNYNGGDLSISENSGKIYVSINGLFYQNEGLYRVLDTSDIGGIRGSITILLWLSNSDANWYPLIWGGDDHRNAYTSTGGVYKSHDVLSWLTSSLTLYATRLATNSIDLQNNRGIYLVTSRSTSPYKGIQLPDLQSNGIGMFSKLGDGSGADEGGIIISADTSVIYNSFDTGWGLSVRDKDINLTDISGDNTIAFGIRQDYRAYSLGGFEKSGSDNSYVLLGGGGHKLESALNVANADTLDGEHASNFVRAGNFESADLNKLDTYSFIKSVNSTNKDTSPKGNIGWYNVILAVHRNGAGDGPGYIGLIALGMTINTDDMFFRGKRTDPWKTVIHSGNIANLSVKYATNAGNADTVDGIHAVKFPYINSSNIWRVYGNSAANALADNTTGLSAWAFGETRDYGISYLGILKPSDNTCGIYRHGTIAVFGQGDTHMGIAVDYGFANFQVFGGNADKIVWRKKVAFTDSNVASATKLQTPRSIWGQSFDGTADIPISVAAKMPFVFFKRFDNNENAGYVGCGASSNNNIYIESYLNANIILDGNNIGIGAYDPSEKLQVNGNIFATGGFKKSGSNDDYVLLGGGGHKVLSDFVSFYGDISAADDYSPTGLKIIGVSGGSNTMGNGWGSILQMCNNAARGYKPNVNNGSANWYTQIMGNTDDKIRYRTSTNGSGWTSWKTLLSTADLRNINVASATKLQTPRSIWGQSFDGTNNVSGDLTGAGSIYTTYDHASFFNKNNLSVLMADYRYTILGYGTAGAGLPTYIDGSPIYMRCGTSYIEALTIINNGNVGIGTTTPAYKLDVNGSIRVPMSLIRPNGGTYYVREESGKTQRTGVIKITFPSTVITSFMVNMWIDVYRYSRDTSFSINCGGYGYGSGSSRTWSDDCFAICYGQKHKVRFGFDGISWCIYIGEVNSTWPYTQVVVRDITLGYTNNPNEWSGQFNVSFETTIVGEKRVHDNYALTKLNTGTYWANLQLSTTSNKMTTPNLRYVLFTKNDGESNLGYIGNATNSNNWLYFSQYDTSSDIHIDSGKAQIHLTGSTGNIGIGTDSPSYKLDVRGDIRVTGQIIREASDLSWVNGRNGALLRETSVAGYHTLWSLKTTNGSWDFGEYNAGSGWDNIPVLSYITDSNYNSGNNTPTYQIKFPLASGTVALTSDILNYYWANVKISTSSSTTTSPTVSNLTATNSIRMGNISLEHTDEINNITNGSIHLNYRNSGNVSLCLGGGSVGIGTGSPSYKLDVNGLMRADGFHHANHDSNNYILLAGGGYKTLNSIYGGDSNHPVFLGYLDLDHGNDGTISSSFYCLGYSVPFTYTRGGNYCRISIPDTTHQVFYIKAAIASVHYSGGGMDTWVGDHRSAGAWWLHCYALSANEVRVKGFRNANGNNDSWWGGNPLYSGNDGANKITVCIFGYVTFR